ncbi:amino acid ABC transporter substrate-binding protein [Clostridium sp. P21]|uniref:Amino acid ABC transporter substrate-binding protein n=1 Tax=Clostridium muellerianum TaxID=2716538 RepID=A0A7Y0EM61_9CLOT|nr:ABC transporter substrate-binding protein [Clostridium muellerianum]NMM66011.1 amino acid ABC transporter substrate-binding protein [Clostridium muellerianum]
MNIYSIKFNKKLYFLIIIIFLVVTISLFFFIKNIKAKERPIIIGFDAQLTGKQAELGIQERNGVQLAVEKINALGGISGRQVQLMVRDDLGIPEQAKKMDKDLINIGSVAIIGHATSAQTLAGINVTNTAKEIMIGPTVSTPELTRLDDYFFRVYPSFKDSSEAFAKYIYNKNNIKHMSIIYDTDNAAYSKDYTIFLKNKFKSLGGDINEEISFSSMQQTDFSPLITKLCNNKPEGLLIVASDVDTALIAKKIKFIDGNLPLFTSAWAQTETLIKNGGTAVEGMKLEQSYALNSRLQSFIDFQSKYKDRFGSEPCFGAAFGYEATLTLIDALKKTGGEKKGLKEELLKSNTSLGLMNNFSFDKFGDVKRPFYLTSINGGKFILVDQLTSVSQ